MFYRRENGVIVGGPYNCDQEFPVDELADDHAEVVAFLAPKAETPTLTLVEQILASPADLAALKKALGL
jgi:hypothetical protein